MASENNLNAVFTDIANAIRDKKGSVNTIKPINMADEINSIQVGGGKSTIYNTLETMGTNWSYAFYVRSSSAYLSIFYYMTEIKESDLPPSNNVVNMSYMFNICANLTTIPLFNTSSCNDMSYMFNSCYKLTSTPPFDTSSCKYMSYMFRNCYILEKIDITKLVSGNNDNFANNCYSLKTLIIRTMDTIPTLNSNAFTNCYHFTGTQNVNYNPDGLKDGAIYVPDDKVESLKTATNWSVFADIIKPLSEYMGE